MEGNGVLSSIFCPSLEIRKNVRSQGGYTEQCKRLAMLVFLEVI